MGVDLPSLDKMLNIRLDPTHLWFPVFSPCYGYLLGPSSHSPAVSLCYCFICTPETATIEIMLFRKDFRIHMMSFMFIMFPAATGLLADTLKALMIKPIQVQKPKDKTPGRTGQTDPELSGCWWALQWTWASGRMGNMAWAPPWLLNLGKEKEWCLPTVKGSQEFELELGRTSDSPFLYT